MISLLKKAFFTKQLVCHSLLSLEINIQITIMLFYFQALIILLIVNTVSCLKCYQCGHYLPLRHNNSAKIYPCERISSEDIKVCKSTEKSCLKFISQGYVVRQCSVNCIPDVPHYTHREIHCCYTDACNSASLIVISHFIIFAFVLINTLK